MDKQLIKQKVIRVYREASEYPDFLQHFKAGIQKVIDSLVPSDVTHSVHVYHDLQYLSEVTKKEGYSTSGFLRLVANYVAMIVKAVEEGSEKVDPTAQPDLFEEGEFKPDN